MAAPSTATGAPDLYPEALRDEIDEVNARVYARRQQRRLPGRLRRHPGGLRGGLPPAVRRASTGSPSGWRGQRYLVGDTITEADVRLFTTLVRFDAVYHGHFKCNRHKLTEMPVLWAYARDLFQTPGFGDTVDFDHIKRHYYGCTATSTRPASCRSAPTCRGWLSPHGREALGGRPFGDGTPPGPPPATEVIAQQL